jgi:hypothetical protein
MSMPLDGLVLLHPPAAIPALSAVLLHLLLAVEVCSQF